MQGSNQMLRTLLMLPLLILVAAMLLVVRSRYCQLLSLETGEE